ncbi:hypothetical protein C4577_06015 [Candidatus Parcubacteria bacterium]|nr:MAG: hypothetical protein C4577_06015 [Candidatus Parcubacteria bacterium]
MKKKIISLLPIFFIFILWIIFSYPYFFNNKIPYPSDYQVNFFPPWSSYEEFWGPIKNNAMPDVVTQIYPWKHFTIETWKMGQIPLWNPNSFVGNVHLANYQSAVLSPFNLLFFLLPFVDAWSLLVLLQPLLAGIFTYVFVRSLKVSKIGSLISSISFMFCGFITVWMAYGTLGYALLFLPLALLGIEKFHQTQQTKYLVLLSLTIPLSFFSGHFQISLYFFATVLAYIIYKFAVTKKVPNTLYLILYAFFGLLLSLPQILPSIESYSQTFRSLLYQKHEAIPLNYILTFFPPDFYGNPVTRNDWFGHYAEWNAYSGVIPLLLAILAAFSRKFYSTGFFVIICLGTFFLAVDTVIVNIVVNMHIPVISTSSLSRIVGVFSFSVAVLAGFGFDEVIKKTYSQKKYIYWIISSLVIFAILWIVVFLKLIPDPSKIHIAKSNLIFPTIIFTLGFFVIISHLLINKIIKFLSLPYFNSLPNIIKQKKNITALLSITILLIISFDLVRFSSKWMPFDPRDRVFPSLAITKFLPQISSADRALGNYGAELSAYYNIPSLEGYDPIYLKRYGEFAAYIERGEFGESGRSVVNFPRSGVYTDKAIDLLGVRYILHKTSDNGVGWTFPYWNYPNKFKLIFEDGKYQVYENKESFPRAFLVNNYKVIKQEEEILKTLFNNSFDLSKEVILEEEPNIESSKKIPAGEAKIIRYMPNSIDVTVNAVSSSILLLTDNYYPGWEAYIDGNKTKIYRGNYTFRAVIVPKGQHNVKFVYNPLSFRIGVFLAILGLLGIVGFTVIIKKRKMQNSKVKTKV